MQNTSIIQEELILRVRGGVTGGFQVGVGNGIYGYDPAWAVFSLSHPLLSEIEILIESWDHVTSYVETISRQNDDFSLSLLDYDAHYTIHAVFQGQAGMV